MRQGSKSKCEKHLMLGALLEVEIFKKCAALWREAHFEIKMRKIHHARSENHWKLRSAWPKRVLGTALAFAYLMRGFFLSRCYCYSPPAVGHSPLIVGSWSWVCSLMSFDCLLFFTAAPTLGTFCGRPVLGRTSTRSLSGATCLSSIRW